ncbi:MAG: hypothetical protein IPK44_02590 [Candidatus Accumulibacter sp.]|uniref:hypothetical protein n=1 Tax=Accumulibacter sp. TaxID=2053492 RepID=UPI00258F6DEF|nr:hypothetical protein [Accumulibacter sp.]MBK8113489.1 hypothetical protein [Accumulibacter sp.]
MGALSALSSRLFTGGFAGAAVVTGLVAMAKTAVDAADALNEMSERTGISVDNLGRLQYAAKLSGVESDVLAKSLQKLSVEIASAAGGSVESAAKFRRFGISVRDSATKTAPGKRSAARPSADAFALLPRAPGRARTGAELFGKSGATLLPLLAGWTVKGCRRWATRLSAGATLADDQRFSPPRPRPAGPAISTE